MTDLREVMARAIARAELGDADQSAIELFWPRFEKHYDAVLRAIEAAGYAVVKKEPDCITPVVAETSNATISEEDKRFSAQATSYAASFLKSYSDTFDAVGARTLEKAFDAMDAASPPLAKET